MAVCVFPSKSSSDQDRVLTRPEAVALLRDASVEELIAVLSRPDERIRVPTPGLRVGSVPGSMWEVALELLASKREEARPLLEQMLNSNSPNTRNNAVHAFIGYDPMVIDDLKPKFIGMLGDPSPRVRLTIVRLLGRMKDEAVEAALLKALSKADAPPSQNDKSNDEIVAIVQCICSNPIAEDLVISRIEPLIDLRHSTSSVTWTTIQASAPLARERPTGKALLARYWKVLRTTRDELLASVAADGLHEKDSRTLVYLRDTPSLRNPRIRAVAAGQLVAHADFDPLREKKLFDLLLHDKDPWVRRNVLGSLCGRQTGIAPEFQVKCALRMLSNDSDKDVRQNALADIIEFLRYVGLEVRNVLIKNPKLALADRMIEACDNAEMQQVVVYQTAMLANQKWQPEEHVAETKKWWENQKQIASRDSE